MNGGNLRFVTEERAALTTTLEQFGPDAPTLCAGWTTRDLLIHLIEREIYTAAGLGSRLPGPWRKKAMARLASLQTTDYPSLVALFRDGRQRYSPLRLEALDSAMNTIEYAVHHEDVLRAGENPQRRTLKPEAQQVIFRHLRPLTHTLLGRSPVRVRIESPGYGHFTVTTTRRHQAEVTVIGEPLEIALFAFGREQHAAVSLRGAGDAVALLRAAQRGF
ncbi:MULTISPECIES: TIGR03085 family metal-binding protein [unclassified Actinobaculum]|uniref:TIGR03085 family metal-binding protein n=1 Tax=unclassified Actinobaculum TaxID=2609299 RepID=UPI000D5275E4|nr:MULTISPECIES: TIGR03085 family metal-binding protein [unclassified Actinobaculum]AWE42404.1 TIGR03085 family protein [Actinobaculum sp. 313]RTE48389.1 TIGR03085 family protein [Actinobaculum sp. 352]